MFYHKKKKDGYYLSSDDSPGEYGPFIGIYIKNTAYGDINTDILDLNKYQSHRFVFGAGKKGVFVIGGQGVLLFISFNHE